ncbi:MAG TPA: hypothetical protein VFA33_15035 [Bryobacteraceae bacterium]|nr:hypothetical protein [Bryobacteraceae bacterium]
MLRRTFLSFSCLALPAAAQNYSGPRPPRKDIPYLVHADNLVPTEVTEAKEQKTKDGITYVIAGANSTARTPLASPIFLLQGDRIEAERLQLYKLESRGEQREITFFEKKKKNNPRPIILEVNRLTSDNLYRLEVDEGLEKGEYSLTPEGSNQVFCFQVY